MPRLRFCNLAFFLLVSLNVTIHAGPPSHRTLPPTPKEKASQVRFDAAVKSGEGSLAEKKWADAAASFTSAIREDKLDGQAHYGLARTQFGLGQVKEAVENYRFLYVVHIDDDGGGVGLTVKEPDAHFNYAIALARAGQADEAVAVYHEGLRRLNVGRGNGEAIPLTLVFPSNEPMSGQSSNYSPDRLEAAAHLAIGISNYFAYEQEGFDQFQQAIKLRPDWALAHFYLGLANWRGGHGDRKIAEAEFDKAISLGGSETQSVVEQIRKGKAPEPKWPTDLNNIRNQKPNNL